MNLIVVMALFLTFLSSSGCTQHSFEHIIINSKDGTMSIGEQVWMIENHSVKVFNNGDSIPQAQSAKEWEHAGKNKQPAWCYSHGDKRRVLYNWYALQDARGLIPDGWHIPTFEEIQYVMKIHNTLNSLIDNTYDYTDAYTSKASSKRAITENHTWYFIPLTYDGNRFGNGKFKGRENIGVFWTSQEPEKKTGYIPVFAQLADEKEVYMIASNPSNGVSVRLIRN